MTTPPRAGVLTLWPHPTNPAVTYAKSGADIADLMAQVGGTWSQLHNAYLIPANLTNQLAARAQRAGLVVTDEPRPDTTRPRTTRQHCPVHGDQPCPPGVTLDDWAQRHPEEAAQLRAGIEKIKARSRDLRTKR